MNILITGANGQLGNEMRVLSAQYPQHTYFFTDMFGQFFRVQIYLDPKHCGRYQ